MSFNPYTDDENKRKERQEYLERQREKRIDTENRCKNRKKNSKGIVEWIKADFKNFKDITGGYED